MAAALIASAHWEVVQIVTDDAGRQYSGLQEAVRALRGHVTATTLRRLRALDAAAAMARRISLQPVREFKQGLLAEFVAARKSGGRSISRDSQGSSGSDDGENHAQQPSDADQRIDRTVEHDAVGIGVYYMGEPMVNKTTQTELRVYDEDILGGRDREAGALSDPGVSREGSPAELRTGRHGGSDERDERLHDKATTTTASHESDDGERTEDDATTNKCVIDVEARLLAVTAQNQRGHHRRTLVRFPRGYTGFGATCTTSVLARAAISHPASCVLLRLSRIRLRAGATRSWHAFGWLCRKGRQSKTTITTLRTWRTTRSTMTSQTLRSSWARRA